MTASTMEASQLPQVEVVHRVLELPMVGIACNAWLSTYSRVKDSNQLIHWTLSMAESSLTSATKTAAPYAKKLETPINFVDRNLCRGLDSIERNIPIVKETPDMIYEAAKNVMNSSLQPTIEKLTNAKESATNQATQLKDISISKANEILSTHYGEMALKGVDSTSALVNRLLDHYFPTVEGEQEPPAPVSADENKVLHAVQTIGQLSTKTANCVYHSIAAQLKTVKKEDVANYMSSVVSILHLINFVNLGQKEPEPTPTQSTTDKTENGSKS
ncbi:unnamed protein product [Trichogramma brassicae]|uniref:Lipid storage droplets surface-binding protein 2 n=1 Tax=Trichogramma brassicae TaxID=86971 RepID=A0A6H5IER3_9HYME|nr:unnamed protein product [Trichogramma brassicae]